MSRDSLSRLSDRDLIHSLCQLVGNERARRVEILHYLNEVERRRLYAGAGCSSLFDYCVTKLRYSRSAAGSRIAAARALRRFPQVGAMLESGDANVVTVATVAKLLTPDNKDALLARIRGRSQDEVARIVAEYRPGPGASGVRDGRGDFAEGEGEPRAACGAAEEARTRNESGEGSARRPPYTHRHTRRRLCP